MSETPSSSPDETRQDADGSDLEELNEDGVGGTLGEKDTFEPEETEDPDADRR
jgi:hypothetical protein